MSTETLDFHIVGVIIFTLLAHLHGTARTRSEKRQRWIALGSVCAIAIILTLRHVL